MEVDMSEALEHLLDCPFCGSPAELQEWEERDATRWAAQANCTGCRAEGPRGYANNDLGCYDAVNDLHKKRATEAWNSRSASTHKAELYDCLRVQAEKMGFRSISDAFDAAMAAQTAQSACPQCGGSMVTWKCLCDPIWRGYAAPQPVDKTLASLSIMQKAFRVTETEGNPNPSKQRFHMRFTFRSLEELHKADDQWRAFSQEAK
jgi:hypothetical protein